MSGRHLGIATASACTAMLLLPGIGAATLAAPAASTAPAATIPAPQASNDPYLVQCLDGDPGMAVWSDSTVAYSDWCVNGSGGSTREPQERPDERGGVFPGPNLPFGPDLPLEPDVPLAP